MTEDEMKTKWCPHAHTITEPLPYGASRIKQTNDGKCIGFGCSQWRWDKNDVPTGTITSNTHGHCGLAGKP